MNLLRKKQPPKGKAQAAAQEPENPWIDDSFRLEEKRWGTWTSYDKEENALVSSLTKELCTEATRFYLKGKQEGFSEAGTSYDGVVGGKI